MTDIQILFFDDDDGYSYRIQKTFKDQGFNLQLHFQPSMQDCSFSLNGFEKVGMIIYAITNPNDVFADEVLRTVLDKIPVLL